MDGSLQSFRRVARFIAALVFWAHALFALHVPVTLITRWAAKVNLTLPEASIIFSLGLLTILYSRGLWKFALDVGYICVFPFVCIYLLARLLFALVRFFFRLSDKEWGAVERSAPNKVVEVKVIAPSGQLEQPKLKPMTQGWWKKAISISFLPFRQYALLWCLLLLLSSRADLVWTALVVILFHLARSLIRMVRLTFVSLAWLGKLEAFAKTRVEGLLGRFAALPKEAELTGELKKSAGILIAIRVGVQLLDSRRQIWIGALALSVCVLAVLYANLALLFSFTYLGLAKVQAIQFTWSQAVVTSFFIPIAYSDLPKNFWLKMCGGLEWLVFFAMTLGLVVTYFQKKFDSLYGLTSTLSSRFADPGINAKMNELLEKLKPKLGGVPP